MLAQMREYVSRSGNRYLTGYMGKTKLVLLQDHNAEITGAEVARWTLHVEEAPPPDERRPTTDTPARGPQLALPAPADHSPRAQSRQAGHTARDRRAADPIIDDVIPF